MQVSQQQQKHVFKYAVVKNTIDKLLIQSEKIKQILDIEDWHLIYRTYNSQKFNEVFLHMSECSANTINLYDNFNSNILKQISNVEYTHLKGLHLSCNNIQNIEPLSFLNLQYLQRLYLYQNNISSTKCFQKLFVPQLLYLGLYENKYGTVDALIKAKMCIKQFRCLRLQEQKQHNPINQDLSFLMKLCCKSIQQLIISSQKRINQQKLKNMIKKRFPQINILTTQQVDFIQLELELD